MSLCECSNCRCRRQWVASSRRHWFYGVATAVTRSQWSGLSKGFGRLMVRRDGGGGFRLGPASLDGLWGRQGQRMQTACVGKVDCGPGLHVDGMDTLDWHHVGIASGLRTLRRALLGQTIRGCELPRRQWATWVMLQGCSGPSVRANELGCGAGGGRAMDDAGSGYSTCGPGSRRPAGARMGHCTNRLGSGRRHGMLPGREGATGARRELDICYGRSARVQGWQQGQT